MHLDDSESDLLKSWIVKRLEDNSDADSDVLADYVLALIKSDESDAQVRQNCIENLGDFLKEHTTSFVDAVLNAIKTKSYGPAAAQQPLSAFAPSFNPSQAPNVPALGPAPSESLTRKRSFQDEDVVMGDGQQYGRRGGRGGGDRPVKQMRRGGRGGFDQRGGRGGSFAQMPQAPQMPGFDPNDPFAALLAMQQAMGMQMPGMPQLPFPPQGTQQPHQAKKPGHRCRDYDNKGYCVRGASCPYEHGNDHIVVPNRQEEYDPSNAMMQNGSAQGGRSFNDRGRGRGRGRGDRGAHRGARGGRADFSSAGPNHDRSITSVVVENIPEDKFEEQAVREFFSEFGTVQEVTLQDYKRLAIIRYPDYDGAKRAYDSPKVIFDNRFVKVYWYKPESLPRPRNTYQNGQRPQGEDTEMREQKEEEKIDPAEFARKQEEAQRVHEEKMAQIKAAQSQREELEQKMKLQAEERNKLLAKLAAKERSKTGGSSEAQPDSMNGVEGEKKDDTSSAQSAALKAKLAALEAEALSMGINPNDSAESGGYQGFGRGRGGFRGRGGWQPRGAWRGGRGAYAGPRAGGVMRLDNRPKALAVVFPNNEELDEGKDEALKQYLLFVSDPVSYTHLTLPTKRIV